MSAELANGTTVEVGRHRLHREGALVKLTLHGDPSVAEMQRFVELYKETIAEEGILLLLVDVRDSRSIPPKPRQILTAFLKDHVDQVGGALFGASYTLRTTVNLFSRALRVLTGRDTHVAFCANEDEARRSIEEQRKDLRPRR